MFGPNEILNGTYRVEREIGRGGTGVVYLAYHLRLQKPVVIKRIHSNFQGALDARTEVDILKNLHHPYLPQVYDFIQQGHEVYTVMDYIDGAGLDTMLTPRRAWPEATLRRWLHQLLDVLTYLHTRRPPIIHSDIKPGNIMLTPQGNVCLIDFNISLDGTAAGKITGYSQNYAAPEQILLAQARLRGQPSRITLDARTDLYSLAATFYTLITGLKPTADGRTPPLRTAAAGRYTDEFLQLLDRAMELTPSRRWPSAKKMQAALERLKRKDRGYRTWLALQAVSWLGSAVLLGGGLFCMIQGARESLRAEYLADYRALTQAVRDGDDEDIEQRCTALLNRESYAGLLEASPRQHGAILHALGDCYYNEEDYRGAAELYAQAVETTDSTDPELESYYTDCAIAYALQGDTDQAADVLADAEQAGLSGARQLLVRTAIESRRGDTEACLTYAQELLNTTNDAELRARGCLLAADAVQDTSARIAWLEAADAAQPTRTTKRKLGAAYVALAQEARTGSTQAAAWGKKALACYEALAAENNAAVQDRLNLAIVQQMLGDAQASMDTLNALEHEEGETYRTQMYLAFAAQQLGNDADAAAYASRAWRLWKETPATDRDSESSEEIQLLKELLS